MNPYKEIARIHLSIEDLQDLITEKQNEPEVLTDRQKIRNRYKDFIMHGKKIAK